MGRTEYEDLNETPKAVADGTPMLASNAGHLASLLKERGHPGKPEGRSAH
jgi:hypothetical protein